jgi:hypothetical protein
MLHRKCSREEISSMTETDIVQMSKDLVASQMEELAGDEDPTPFQVIKDSNNTLSIALVHIPEGPQARDKMADFLTAACCVHRATEATFLSAAWSSMYSNVADVGKVMPSQRPNRVEVVTLVHVKQQKVETHTAAILRVDGKVRLSPWLFDSDFSDSGRIPSALLLGIALGEEMPPDMIEVLDDALQNLPIGRVMEMFVKQLDEVRDWLRDSAERN